MLHRIELNCHHALRRSKRTSELNELVLHHKRIFLCTFVVVGYTNLFTFGQEPMMQLESLFFFSFVHSFNEEEPVKWVKSRRENWVKEKEKKRMRKIALA